MTSYLHIHLTHEINTRHERRYFGTPVGNYIDLSQNVQLCRISPAETDKQDILYSEVHRVDVGGDEVTDEEERMESQLSSNHIREVQVASQDIGEENFEDRQWFRWFIRLVDNVSLE